MGNPFPAELTTDSGQVTFTGEVTFTDPDNQPGSAGNLVTSVFTRTGAVVATSGDYTAAEVTHAADKSSASAQVFTGEVDAASLGATIPYVTVQAMPPAGAYQTPLVYDSTAVTGGCYAWDGSAYQQVSNVVS